MTNTPTDEPRYDMHIHLDAEAHDSGDPKCTIEVIEREDDRPIRLIVTGSSDEIAESVCRFERLILHANMGELGLLQTTRLFADRHGLTPDNKDAVPPPLVKTGPGGDYTNKTDDVDFEPLRRIGQHIAAGFGAIARAVSTRPQEGR